MARKSKNPIETLREQGVDVEKVKLPPEMKAKFDAYKQRLADEEAGFQKGLKEGKGSLARRAAGAAVWNPVTRTVVLGGLGAYGVLTGLKLANAQPSWLNAGQLDRASDASAAWLRTWGRPGGAPRP
ncbi:MAG TPA: hypothetical protein PKV72_06455 [Candidatus Peribacteria bacterium]|nr:hypothetical protein [Candidatus Peribacteria bacterium]